MRNYLPSSGLMGQRSEKYGIIRANSGGGVLKHGSQIVGNGMPLELHITQAKAIVWNSGHHASNNGF